MATKSLQIDIISDVMCPWCIVGYRRLEQALSQFEDIDVSLQWHPFELNPAMGPDGQHLGEHIAEKYGSTPEQSAQNRQRLTQMGADLGFEFKRIFPDLDYVIDKKKALFSSFVFML